MKQVTNSVGAQVDYEVAVQHMDDGLREALHMKWAPCSEQEFFRAYAEAHEEQFGEIWIADQANPVW